MVQNKKLSDELKKFNQELDKHLPNLNLDFMNPPKSLFDDESDSGDMSALVLSNLSDLRTEMALMRKHLSVDVAGMVKDTLGKQQKEFVDSMAGNYRKFASEIKDGFGAFIKDLSDQVLSLKKEVTDISSRFKDSENFTKELKNEVSDVSEKISGFAKKLELHNDLFKNRIKGMEDEFKKNLISQQKSLVPIEKEIDKVKKELFNVIENSNKQRVIENSSIPKIPTDPVFEDESSNNSYDSEELSVSFVPENSFQGEDRVSRILDIDEKLKRLSALKE